MSLTQKEDFKGLYYIPNATDVAPNSSKLGNTTLIMQYVDKYEKDALIRLLGYDLYVLLEPELLKKPFNPDGATTADDIWLKLVNGDGKYRGIREALIGYCFYQFYEDDMSQYTGVGEKTIRSKDMVEASPAPRATKVWRQFYDLTIGNAYDHTIVINQKYGYGIIHGDTMTPYTSLYSYMRENADSYPEWEGTYFDNKTQYGF